VHSVIRPQIGWENGVFKAGAAVENFVHNIAPYKKRVTECCFGVLLHKGL
jgi:hypothetical protein